MEIRKAPAGTLLAPSTSPFGYLDGDVTQVVPSAAGDVTVGLGDLTYITPDDWWGSPGVGLSLALAVASDRVSYPAEDRFYDVFVQVTAVADAADAGKEIVLLVTGNDRVQYGSGLITPSGDVSATVSFTDIAFLGDGTGSFFVVRLAPDLRTADMTINHVTIRVIKRA
jgi:hypothetical protein